MQLWVIEPSGPVQELHGGRGGDLVEGSGRLYGRPATTS
jgi:hypothetical protein